MEFKRLEFKALNTDTEQGVFEGHASVWDVVDSEGDIVERGAFAKTITEGAAKDGVPILVLHNDQLLPVGRSLELREDDEGLYIKGYISPTSMGNDVRTLIRDRVLRELSIGYIPVQHKMDGNIRHLIELDLPEISIVTWAANSAAKITGYKGGTHMQDKSIPAAAQDSEKTIDELLAEGRELMRQLIALGIEIPQEEQDFFEFEDDEEDQQNG